MNFSEVSQKKVRVDLLFDELYLFNHFFKIVCEQSIFFSEFYFKLISSCVDGGRLQNDKKEEEGFSLHVHFFLNVERVPIVRLLNAEDQTHLSSVRVTLFNK